MWIDPTGRGSLLVGNGQTLDSLDFRVGVSGTYTYGNFRGYRFPTGEIQLRDRFGVQVFGGIGLTNWLELGVNVPVYFAQSSISSFPVQSSGLGNPWAHVKVGLLRDSAPVNLSIGVGVGFPAGTAPAQAGRNGYEFLPRLTLGKVWSDFQFGLEAAFLYRPTTDYSGYTGAGVDKVGSQVSLAFQVSQINASGPRGEFSLRGFASVAGARAGVEAQLGVRYPIGNLELFASAGPGLFGEPATPSARVYLGAAFGSGGMTRAPCLEGSDYDVASCPELDKDKDGIKNMLDQAPLDPEDKDGFQDTDGKPDPDNDNDGVLDAADKCPNEAGLAENAGCPDVDSDKDGIMDRMDKCPNEAEDKDGFEDEDGCPDLDDDKDGVPDAKDACPREAGIPEEKGCPVKDSDGDGVADFEDNCLNEKGVKENRGCPAAQKQMVVITRESLKILDKVYFDTGKSVIQKRSFPLLDQVASILNQHTEIDKIQVEGHTDNVGKPEKNKALSQARADAVKAYLVKKSVAEGRLVPMGFGQDKPAGPNDTPAGRDNNRRVEFNIIKQ
jgi:OmpA-OmpF porin, OOP family